MSGKSNLVNLDAMIKREDFASEDAETPAYENVNTVSIRDFTGGGLIGPSLRKPDFQRETNHWSSEQVVSLLECFVNGDLIPSVILWQSPSYLFVIDGGHRLSVLKAWIEDDYGDGPTSQAFFGYQISDEQRETAEKTRSAVNKAVGSWKHHETRILDVNLDPKERRKLSAVVTRALPIQWVTGDADKAESSFFKINTKGTPLDDIEELLLRNRRKPISIAARAVIRAGMGHRYWSAFPSEIAAAVELAAKALHVGLFDPEIRQPIKTLDLPLGGPKGIRTALQTLIDLILIANRNQAGEPKKISDLPDDQDGSLTQRALAKTKALVDRVTGNEGGSLGLHPAVYFYGPTGRHSTPLFMGTMALLAHKLVNNDPTFFPKFTKIRSLLETLLIEHKDLIATILQRSNSTSRADKYTVILRGIIDNLTSQKPVSEADIIDFSALNGRVLVAITAEMGKRFSDDTKSQVFISTALASAPKCPICDGYLDPEKSISYDHIIRAQDGGTGHVKNLQLTHPYCNQSIKN